MTIPYPELLKKAGWDKHKGIVAKVLKNDTGVGAACEKAEKAYGAIVWDAFSVGKLMAAADKSACVAIIEAAKNEYKGHIMPTSTAVMELAKTATTAAAGFKKATLVPKSSTEYAEKMAAAAKAFAQQLTGHAELLMKDFLRAENICAKQAGLTLDVVWGNAKLKAALRARCEKEHSMENFLFLEEYGSSPPQGAKAVELYNKFIAKTAPMAINANNLGMFHTADSAIGAQRNPARFDGCPWAGVHGQVKLNIAKDTLTRMKNANLLAVLA